MILNLWAKPWLRAAASRLITPRPALIRQSSSCGHQFGRFAHLSIIRVAHFQYTSGQAMGAKYDVNLLPLLLRPLGKANSHSIGKRLNQQRRIVIAGNMLELNLPMIHLDAIGNLCLIPLNTQFAKMWSQNHTDGMGNAIVDHLTHDFLNPWRPVAHTHIY